jgi:PIN domain nuclease of toxin-antitoxin system
LGLAEVILADTHVVLWLALEPDQLSANALKALSEARENQGGVAIADISLWEIAVAVSRGKVLLETELSEFLRFVEEAYRVIPMTGEIAEQGAQFSRAYPRDPADKLIGATALVHGLQLVTKDEPIRDSGEVPVVW